MDFSCLIWIFPVCHFVYTYSSLSDRWCYLQTPCISAVFSCLLWIFPVIHFWSFVHHSSMFRVVDVLCAVRYTAAEDEWIFFLSVVDFFLCVMFYTVQ